LIKNGKKMLIQIKTAFFIHVMYSVMFDARKCSQSLQTGGHIKRKYLFENNLNNLNRSPAEILHFSTTMLSGIITCKPVSKRQKVH
jgi:hypothetical protein